MHSAKKLPEQQQSPAQKGDVHKNLPIEPKANIPQVHTLLTWSAPGRPFRKRQREYYINIILLMIALEIILFLFSQYVLMLVILSLAFLAFAFAVTPPDHINYRISTEGVSAEDHFYLWQELYDFYFKERSGHDMLHIRTKSYWPGEITMLFGDVSKEKLKQTLLPYLPYREIIHATFTDHAGDWLVKTFPLEKHSPKVASK